MRYSLTEDSVDSDYEQSTLECGPELREQTWRRNALVVLFRCVDGDYQKDLNPRLSLNETEKENRCETAIKS